MHHLCASVTVLPLLLCSLLFTSVAGRVHNGVHHGHKHAHLAAGALDDGHLANGSIPESPTVSILDSLDALRLQRRQFAATTTTWTTVWVTSTITRTFTTTGPVAEATSLPSSTNSFAFDPKGSTNIAVYYGQSPGTVRISVMSARKAPSLTG